MNIGIKDVLNQIRLFFILYLLLLIACLIIKLIYSRAEIYFAVNNAHSSWADAVTPYITDLGEGWTIIILSAVWGLFNYRQAFLMATSYGVTSLLAQIIKPIFHTPRPELYFKGHLNRIHFVKGVEIFSHNSFPSGHTITAFSAAAAATYFCKNKNWGALFLFVAVLVGYSRMYLSEHFFEDVIAGSVIGVMVTVFWITWLDSRSFLHGKSWNRGVLN